MSESQTKTREAMLDELLETVCAIAEAAEFNCHASDTLANVVVEHGKAVADLTMAEMVELIERARERYNRIHGEARCYVEQGRG